MIATYRMLTTKHYITFIILSLKNNLQNFYRFPFSVFFKAGHVRFLAENYQKLRWPLKKKKYYLETLTLNQNFLFCKELGKASKNSKHWILFARKKRNCTLCNHSKWKKIRGNYLVILKSDVKHSKNLEMCYIVPFFLFALYISKNNCIILKVNSIM